MQLLAQFVVRKECDCSHLKRYVGSVLVSTDLYQNFQKLEKTYTAIERFCFIINYVVMFYFPFPFSQ